MRTLDITTFKKAISKHKILSCLVHYGDNEVLRYFSNKKTENQLHTINSVTKSIVGLLVGIALEEKLIESIDMPIITYFPEYINLFDDSRKQEITLRHLLSMTDGMDWPEFGSWNYFAPMVYQSDIIAYILSRPMVHAPGKIMNYNSGSSHLIGAIIQKVSNQKIHDYAKRKLFLPLGILESHWHEKQGVSLASDGLKLKIDDMLKIGKLILNHGQKIVPENWIRTMTTPFLKTYASLGHYGYHIWIDEYRGTRYHYALGYGGQFLVIVPKHCLVIVLTSRLYKDSMFPLYLIKEHIFDQLNGSQVNI